MRGQLEREILYEAHIDTATRGMEEQIRRFQETIDKKAAKEADVSTAAVTGLNTTFFDEVGANLSGRYPKMARALARATTASQADSPPRPTPPSISCQPNNL